MPDAVALERALKKQVPPDLLLLDLMLREKNGFAVMKEWKARAETRRIPVIIISARSAEHDKVMGAGAGAEDYITKPFGVRELQARVQAALRRLPASVEKLCVGALTLLPATREAYVDGNRVDLTQKEFELLLYLAPPRGFHRDARHAGPRHLGLCHRGGQLPHGGFPYQNAAPEVGGRGRRTPLYQTRPRTGLPAECAENSH